MIDKKDLRYLKIKSGLSKLTETELIKIIDYPNEMVYDDYNFDPITQRF